MVQKSKLIIGIDEVGRGPLAGPLVAAAVLWPETAKMSGLKDSKLLNFTQRQKLVAKIRHQAMGIGIGWVGNTDVDELGLTEATRRCMLTAIKQLTYAGGLPIIIDGNYNYLARDLEGCVTVIKADQTHACVMAAAIVAKVARDNFMRAQDRLYPGYGFERHVGYATRYHKDQITSHGPSPLHRLSFKPLLS